MSATASIILDTRRMKQAGVYPVKLRVTYHRKYRDYPAVFDLSKEDYEKLQATRINENLQTIRNKLKSIKRLAEDFIKDANIFSFYEFEQGFIINNDKFKQKKPKEVKQVVSTDYFDYSPYFKRFSLFNEDHSKAGSISIVYFEYIKTLLQQERIGTALSYQQSYNSIKKFKGNVLFTDITVGFLYQYEKWMLGRKCTLTTIGIKLRALRTMFNEAILIGIIKKEKCYPFGRRKYQIPTGRNIKKALHQDQIAMIYFDKPLSESERKAKDLWFFCYFGNGMNPKDLVYLKNRNVQGEFIIFNRFKTDRTTRSDPKPITVYVTEEMREIIKCWKNPDQNSDAYLFPVMDDSLNPLRQYELVTVLTKFINDHMENIRRRLRIDNKITTIVSRHSFATQLKRSGVSTEFIQEAFGHTDKKTTEIYLDNFEAEIKKEYANKLTAFKSKSSLKTA
jgi:integrase/recombinase XerD